MMKKLQGYKRLIGLLVGAAGAVGLAFGYLTVEQAAMVEGLAVVIFGAGYVDASKRGARVMEDVLAAVKENAPKLLLGLLAAGLLFGSAPAYAADCDFEDGVDAKIARFAWPPSFGVNAIGFLDTEAGFPGITNVCGNVSVNPVGGFCLIPKVGDMMGPLCPSSEPAPE